MLSPLKFFFSRGRAAAAPLLPPADSGTPVADAEDSVITMDPALLSDDEGEQDEGLDSVMCVSAEAPGPTPLSNQAPLPLSPAAQAMEHGNTSAELNAPALPTPAPESAAHAPVAASADMRVPHASAAFQAHQPSMPAAQTEAHGTAAEPQAKSTAKPSAARKPKASAKPKATSKQAGKAKAVAVPREGEAEKDAAKPRRAPAKRGLNMSLSTSDWILPGDPRAPKMTIVYPKEDPIPQATPELGTGARAAEEQA